MKRTRIRTRTRIACSFTSFVSVAQLASFTWGSRISTIRATPGKSTVNQFFLNNYSIKLTISLSSLGNDSSPTMSHNADYLISYISTATRFLSSTPLTPPVSSLFFEILSEPYLAFFSNVLTMVSSTSSPSSTSFSAITAIESTVLLVENIKHISISSNSHHIIINPISSKLSDSPLSNCSPTILYPKGERASLKKDEQR